MGFNHDCIAADIPMQLQFVLTGVMTAQAAKWVSPKLDQRSNDGRGVPTVGLI